MGRRSPSLFFIFIIVGAAIFLLSNQEKAYPVSTKVLNNVKVIMNPDYPRDGRFTMKLTEEVSMGAGEGQKEAILSNPIDLNVDGHGDVYVLDVGDTNIKVYDNRGRFVRAVGRKGQGPGEFGFASGFGLTSDGRVCVLDDMSRRVTFLNKEGQYLSGFRLDGFFRDMKIDGQNRIFLAKFAQAQELPLSTELKEVPCVTSIYRTDDSGKKFFHVEDFLGENIVQKTDGKSMLITGFSEFVIIWNVNREGKLCAGYNGDYRLTVYSPDGKKDFIFGRKFTPLKNKDYKGMAGEKSTMPAFMPFTLFDEEGNIWIEQYKEKKSEGLIYDVFSPDGIYAKQVKIDSRIYQFKGGKAYGISKSEEGFPLVKRYKIKNWSQEKEGS
jgi:hypothetical protein